MTLWACIQMKLLRLQISGKLIEILGRQVIFDDLEWFEVLNAYQYDQQNFFSLQRYKFKPDSPALENLEEFLTHAFNTKSYQVMEQSGREYICFVKQDLKNAFFRVVEPGPWAVTFPVYVDPERILINIIAMEKEIPNLLQKLSKFTDSYKIIALTTMKPELGALNMELEGNLQPTPTFTGRQQEIGKYAVEHGYYRAPRDISAQDLADRFGISESAVNSHLRKIEAIAVSYFFGE